MADNQSQAGEGENRQRDREMREARPDGDSTRTKRGPYKRHSRREKLATVIAAEMTGVIETAERTGIPESTIRYWIDDPEFAAIRARTREQLADEIKTVAHLAWQRIAKALRDGTAEPRDAIFAAEKATSLYQLVTGMATSRTESRDLTGTLDDAELVAAIREADAIARGVAPPAADPAEGAGL